MILMGQASRRLALWVVLSLASTASALTLSCGSDYQTPTVEGGNTTDKDGAIAADGGAAATGALGGDCYPNDTCDQGLSCSAGICLRSSSDGGTSAIDSGTKPSCASVITVGDGCFFSGGGPPSGIECIAPTGGAYNATCSTIDAGCANKQIGCLSASDCNASSGSTCCFAVTVTPTSGTLCAATASINSTTVSACAKGCGGAGVAVGCRTSKDCPGGGPCRAITANMPNDAGLSVFGVCSY